MSFGMWDASVPMFVNSLTNMRGWLDKAAQEKDEATLMEARLAPDMRPLPAQYQMASDFGQERACPAHRHRGPVYARHRDELRRTQGSLHDGRSITSGASMPRRSKAAKIGKS